MSRADRVWLAEYLESFDFDGHPDVKVGSLPNIIEGLREGRDMVHPFTDANVVLIAACG